MSDIARMLKDKWAELLVLGAVFGLYGVVFYDVRDRLTRAESSNEATKERLDRIANAFPEVGVRVATETALKSVGTMVLVSFPTQVQNKWQSTASVYDLENGKATNFVYSLSDQNDIKSIWALEGAIGSTIKTGNEQLSLKYLEQLRMSGLVKEKLDQKVLLNSSYVFSRDYNDLIAAMKSAGAVQKDATTFRGGEYNWDEAVGLIKSGNIPAPQM